MTRLARQLAILAGVGSLSTAVALTATFWNAERSLPPTAARSADDVEAATSAEQAASALAESSLAAERHSQADAADLSAKNERSPFDDSQHAVLERLKSDVRYLASDELEGRGPKTDGLDKAADYLAEQFAAAGWSTDRYDGTPFQQFTLSSSTRLGLGEPNELTFHTSAGARKSLELGWQFTPLSLSSSGQFDLPLAFVGYGIQAPELDYDDYADIDVAGKAVVMLRREPRQDDAESPFNGTKYSEHAFFQRKIETAVANGARAVVFCTDNFSLATEAGTSSRRDEPATALRDPLLDFQVKTTLSERSVPVIHVRREVVDEVLSAAGERSLSEIEADIDRTLEPQSFTIDGWQASGTVSIVRQRRLFKNVVAVLDGEGPLSEETIVVGAHYDHLGRGGMGSLAAWTVDIHNGADDNASGTAVLLEIARQLAARRTPLRRRVVCIGFTAEEMGLIGSERYVRNPLFSLEKTVAMLNLDMVGRMRNDLLTVNGTGTAVEFDGLVSRLAANAGLRAAKSPSGYGPSDHASFHARGIPVLHFFTGLHQDYHRPSDDFDKLNYEGMRRITAMAVDAVIELAQADSRPQRRGSDLFAAASTSLGSLTGGTQRTTVSYLGVIRDPDDDQPGFLVSQVVAKSPAEAAGIRQGDRIQSFDEITIGDSESLIEAVRRKKPGEEVKITVRRDDRVIQVAAKIGARTIPSR